MTIELTIPLWQAGLIGIAIFTLLAAIDVAYQSRRRAKWDDEHTQHLANLRRFGMGKLKEIPAPAPMVEISNEGE